MIEHPEITNAIRTGYPHGEPKWPTCPVCGAECSRIYRDEYGEIFACDECVKIQIAADCEECF